MRGTSLLAYVTDTSDVSTGRNVATVTTTGNYIQRVFAVSM
jgi:hypothetical protein